MSNLSQIKADSNWGDASNTINTNFQNMDVELEKLKNSTTRFKGYFTNETNLKNKFPSPKRGDIAFVGEPYPGNVYDVLTDGSWHNTTKAPETGSVDLQDYVTKDDFEASQKEQDDKLTELESKTEEIKNTKQDNLTFDKAPTLNSPNPVTSGGIKEALDLQKNEVEAAKDEALNSISERESSAILNFNKQKVTPEMLSQSVKDLINTAGGGTINNMPDEEDIQSVDDGTGSQVLKFNDRAYNPSNFSGKGYKILRKNIVDGKNVLTQEMINQENTVYEIRYDFDLNGVEINIPEGCSLIYNGGSLNNGFIIGNNTFIKEYKNKEILLGSFLNINDNSDKYVAFDNHDIDWANFPKLNNGKYIITAYCDSETKKTFSFDCKDAENKTLLNKKIYAQKDGYTQILDLSDVPENVIRFALLTAEYLKIVLESKPNIYRKLRVYDTFVELNNDDQVSPNDICFVQGYYKKFDDGDAFWIIEPLPGTLSLKYINNITIGAAKYIGSAFKKLKNGNTAVLLCKDNKVNVVKLGVKNNGEDTTRELQEIIDLKLDSYSKLYFPGGRYYFTDTINFYSTIVLEGEMPINVASFSASSNGYPIWNPDYNDSIINNSANGNSLTIFRFNFGENENKDCIVFRDPGSIIKNIVITNNSFSMENILGGDVVSLPSEPLKPIINKNNINGVINVKGIENCSFIGFSGIAIKCNVYASIKESTFNYCNLCIETLPDTVIDNIRVNSSVTISKVHALCQISNVRGDSVRGPVFRIISDGSVFRNILIDYSLKSVFELERTEFVDIEAQCARSCVNSWNKNIDDKGSLSLDEYFIHIPEGKIIKGLKANVYFYDPHAIDQTSNPNYDTSILYPAILSIENNSKILRLDATFSYGGKNSYTLEDKEASLKRMITINENSYVSGRLNTRNKTFILNNYNGKNNYVDGLFNAGNSANRKSINNLIYQYFDLDLSKLLIFNGEKFVTADGLPINVIKQGTFAQKPNSAQGIEVGFQYFCTDKQTREGTTNGIMIYYKGGDVWVDALGRVVE